MTTKQVSGLYLANLMVPLLSGVCGCIKLVTRLLFVNLRFTDNTQFKRNSQRVVFSLCVAYILTGRDSTYSIPTSGFNLTASSKWSGAKCEYFMVSTIEACPSILCSTKILTPFIIK